MEEDLDLAERLRTNLRDLIERDAGGVEAVWAQAAGVHESTVNRTLKAGFATLSKWGQYVENAGGLPSELLEGVDSATAVGEAQALVDQMDDETRALALVLLRRLLRSSKADDDVMRLAAILHDVPEGRDRTMVINIAEGAASAFRDDQG